MDFDFLEIIIEQSNVPVIVDAGIGAPSDASKAMELGADAVLVNTAIAVSDNPIEMGKAFKLAVEAGAIVNGTCKMPEGDFIKVGQKNELDQY